MVSILDLWLPILLSAVLVFVVSSIVHMVLPIHKSDWQKFGNEDAVLAAMREQGVKPGQYMFPCPSSMKDMASPEMIAKYDQGPVGWTVIMPNGPIKMGASLVQWFVFSVVISVFAGYVGTYSVAATDTYGVVFRKVGTVAILGYAFSNVTDSIWKGVRWSTTLRYAFDGVVYGLVTAGTFAWLWPEAA